MREKKLSKDPKENEIHYEDPPFSSENMFSLYRISLYRNGWSESSGLLEIVEDR